MDEIEIIDHASRRAADALANVEFATFTRDNDAQAYLRDLEERLTGAAIVVGPEAFIVAQQIKPVIIALERNNVPGRRWWDVERAIERGWGERCANADPMHGAWTASVAPGADPICYRIDKLEEFRSWLLENFAALAIHSV